MAFERFNTLTLSAFILQITFEIMFSQIQASSHALHAPAKVFEFESSDRISEKAHQNVLIPVNIRIEPLKELNRKIYVKTGATLTATAEILDDKFGTNLTYQWSAKNKVIVTDSKASRIEYKYDHADEDNFLKVLVVHKPDDTGECQKTIAVRDPVEIANPVGKPYLEHGELLDIRLQFNGTGPFKFCREFCHLEKNHDCQECSPDTWTDQNEVKIIKYLSSIGNYSLIFVVDNYASRQSKTIPVRILDTVRHQTTPIVPIVCSIVAVLILLSGVILSLKCKTTAYTETADFDFTRNAYEDEDLDQFWDQELSFIQKVRYILFHTGTDRNNSLNESDMSASITRLIS